MMNPIYLELTKDAIDKLVAAGLEVRSPEAPLIEVTSFGNAGWRTYLPAGYPQVFDGNGVIGPLMTRDQVQNPPPRPIERLNDPFGILADEAFLVDDHGHVHVSPWTTLRFDMQYPPDGDGGEYNDYGWRCRLCGERVSSPALDVWEDRGSDIGQSDADDD